jgi:ubiquinone biosynthesis protein UbiJ
MVRSSGALGKILYQGTLEKGQHQRFDGKVLWLQLETPPNVLVKLNGNRVKLARAVKAQGVFVTAKKIFAADSN